MADERGGNEGENVHPFASPVPVCPNSTLRSVTPFDLLVAALGDDSIVGTDDPDAPLTRDGLAALVSQPALMSAFVGFRFKFRTSNKKLDGDTLQKLCSKAICALRISECSQHEPALGTLTQPCAQSRRLTYWWLRLAMTASSAQTTLMIR